MTQRILATPHFALVSCSIHTCSCDCCGCGLGLLLLLGDCIVTCDSPFNRTVGVFFGLSRPAWLLLGFLFLVCFRFFAGHILAFLGYCPIFHVSCPGLLPDSGFFLGTALSLPCVNSAMPDHEGDNCLLAEETESLNGESSLAPSASDTI